MMIRVELHDPHSGEILGWFHCGSDSTPEEMARFIQAEWTVIQQIGITQEKAKTQ